MTVFQSPDFFSDDRFWRLRAWLLERVITVMSGDLRWALLAFGCRLMSASLTQARLRLAAAIRC